MGRKRNRYDMITVVDLDGNACTIERRITRTDAWLLVESGHARWKRQSMIELLRNIPMGPALSMRIGGELAYKLGLGEPWAKIAVQEIVGRKGV